VSAEAVLDALLGVSLSRGNREALLLQTYTRRLLELERGPVYDYMYVRDLAFLDSLPQAVQKARFVLTLWGIAPPEHWQEWASAMPHPYKGGGEGIASAAAAVVEHMLQTAATLEPDAARSVVDHLPPRGSALAALADPEDVARIEAAAGAALGDRVWWGGGEEAELQVALLELIRSVEVAVPPGVSDDLRGVRALDVVRGPLDEPDAVRAMLSLAQDLDPDVYDELEEALPEPDPDQRPVLYAEIVVARVLIHVRDPMRGGGGQLVAAHLRRIRRLREMGGDYWRQRRAAAVDCLNLRPTPAQIGTLSAYIGSNPSPEALESLRSWAAGATRKDLSDAISRLIRPLLDASQWAAALSQEEYVEKPVVQRLAGELLKEGTKAPDRRRMAAIVKGLRLRTQSARGEVADLIVALLKSKPKANLSVALVLCEGLGPEHQRDAKLKRAFEYYARKHDHPYTPSELQAIGAVDVEVASKHLSKGAVRRSEEIVAEGLRKVRGLGKFVGLSD